MKLNDKQKVLGIFAVLSLVLIAVGVSVAFFTYSKDGTTENTIKSGSITFLYDEINQSGNSIGITDALPISDTDGKAQTNYFNFKIVSTASTTTSIPYEITLRQKEETDNIGNKVKVYLSKIFSYNSAVNTEEEITTSLFSSLQTVTHNNYSEKLLHTDLVPASDTRYEQYYRLKMWLDESATLSSTEETFTVTVNVYANGHVLDANSSVATVNSVSVGGNALTVTSTENNIDYYEATLPEGTTQTTLSIDTGDYDRVTITKTQSDYTTPIASSNNITKLSNTLNKTVSLTDGANYFKIIATSEDGLDSKEIHVKITIARTVQILGQNYELIENMPTLTGPSSNCIKSSTTNKYDDCTKIDEAGLYAMDVTNGFGGADGTTYYFRGNVNNNYVSFGKYNDDLYYGYYFSDIDTLLATYSSYEECSGASSYNYNCTKIHGANEPMIWRIVRINEDGTIRLVLNDSIDAKKYSSITSDSSGTRSYVSVYYSTTDIAKPTIDDWYTNNIASSGYASKVASGNYFCEAVKVSDNDHHGINASLQAYDMYIPDLKCVTDGNGKGILQGNPSVGLLTYDEVVLAGGYHRKSSNYYLSSFNKAWLMSSAGVRNGGGNYIDGWSLADGFVGSTMIGNSYRFYPVINLKADVTATGTGTSSDPYVIQ